MEKIYKLVSNFYWDIRVRKLYKISAYGTVLALLSLALGLLINDMTRGYCIIISLYFAKALYDWAKKEFQFV